MKVLLVDDDPDLVVLATWALQAGGHEVVASEGGAGVLETIRQERPEVILMDLLMPEIDGAEQVRRLRADPDVAATPVIFLTGKEAPDDLEPLRALEPRGILVKPVDPETLAAEVERLAGPLPNVARER